MNGVNTAGPPERRASLPAEASSKAGQFPQQRVGVFVDIQNMYYSARAVYGKKVNFQAILEAAVAGRHLVRALAYGITTEEAHEGEFHEALSKQGFEVKTKPLQTFIGGQKKGDWDIGIAMDILRLERKIDVAVLVCGDGDFIPLVRFAKERGLRMEIMGFRESTSSALIEEADSFFDLSGEPGRFLIGPSSHAPEARGGPPTPPFDPRLRAAGRLRRAGRRPLARGGMRRIVPKIVT